MAASNTLVTLKNVATGQLRTISLYNASSAEAGTFLPVEISGQEATTNSDETLILSGNYIIHDIVSEAATGVIELIRNGLPVGYAINYASQQSSNAGRAIPLGFQIVSGERYKFRVVSALAA